MLNHTLVYFHWVCLHAHSFESYPGFEHEKLFYIVVDMIRLLITCRCVCFLNMSHFCLIRCFFLFHFSSVSNFLQTKIRPHPGFWSQVLTFTWETHNECSCLTLSSCSFNTAQIQTIQQHLDNVNESFWVGSLHVDVSWPRFSSALWKLRPVSQDQSPKSGTFCLSQ